MSTQHMRLYCSYLPKCFWQRILVIGWKKIFKVYLRPYHNKLILLIYMNVHSPQVTMQSSQTLCIIFETVYKAPEIRCFRALLQKLHHVTFSINKCYGVLQKQNAHRQRVLMCPLSGYLKVHGWKVGFISCQECPTPFANYIWNKHLLILIPRQP